MEVEFTGVNKKYGDFYAVRDLNLKIKSGALHFLLGPSGCGKTTTLRMLAGLETVTSGKIMFDGKDVTHQPATDRGIGMVFQNYALWPHMTVRKNIEYGLKLRKLTAEQMKQRMDEVLDITQLGPFVERLPGQLSGGQQQRVALARALAIRPNVLLLDEPLSNLDAKLRLEMRDNISRIHKQTGITTVYVTHDQKEALSMGTHVSVQRAGSLIQTDPPRTLYHHPETPFIANFIGETNLVPATWQEGGDHPKVKTSFGVMSAGGVVGDYKAGDPVTISFRPETIHVWFDGKVDEGRSNVMEVSLDLCTYLGESEQMQFKTADGAIIKTAVFNPPEHNLKDGDKVKISVEPRDVLVLPHADDISSGT